MLSTRNIYHTLWVCVCGLSYRACNAHAPYCHLSPLRLYRIFPRYLINGMIFGKKVPNTKCVFWFSLQLLSETFHILRRIQRDIVINVHKEWYKEVETQPIKFISYIMEEYNVQKLYNFDVEISSILTVYVYQIIG